MENAIFFGNGFNLVSENRYSWSELLKEMGDKTEILSSLPPTMQYEYIFLNSKRDYKDTPKKPRETRFKEAIVKRIKEFKHNEFYDRLIGLNVRDYLTTNYDDAFFKDTLDVVAYIGNEKIYSIRRRSELQKNGERHSKYLFHLHGHIKRIASIMIGFDQYIGASRRVDQWVKGEYARTRTVKGTKVTYDKVPSIAKRLNDVSMNGDYGIEPTKTGLYSWIDAFFFRNLHIIGFALEFCESDIWWLLVKRARLIKKDGNLIRNKIFYYVTDPFHLIDKHKLDYLRTLDVEIVLHDHLGGIDGTEVDYKAIYSSQISNLEHNLTI